MRGKAYRVARPAQTRLQNSRVAGPKFTKFLSDSDIIGGVNARIHPLTRPLWYASAQNEGGVCQFSPIRGKKIGT